eukprot:gene14188-19039_t
MIAKQSTEDISSRVTAYNSNNNRDKSLLDFSNLSLKTIPSLIEYTNRSKSTSNVTENEKIKKNDRKKINSKATKQDLLFIDLTKLQHLKLSKNDIAFIDVQFSSNYLLSIDLSKNKLVEFNTMDFIHIPFLNEINLNHNSITKINISSFFLGLETLKLSHNNIESIPEEINTLTNLKTLDLSFNKIKNISKQFENLQLLYDLNLNNNEGFNVDDSETGPRCKWLYEQKSLCLSKSNRRGLIQRFLTVHNAVIEKEKDIVLNNFKGNNDVKLELPTNKTEPLMDVV